jgi:soluble lytic murein transglycosylase-like protein
VPEGVEVEGEGVLRSPGRPATATKLWKGYHYPLYCASAYYGVPVELLIATMATESSGRASALRKEPGYISDEETPHRISPGVMQTLISTARRALRGEVPAEAVTRRWLLDPQNSIRAGTKYIMSQSRETRFDPPLVASAYNAGGVYLQRGTNNRWKTRQYPIGTGEHVDRFVKWYNDAVHVVSSLDLPTTLSHQSLVEDST